MEQDVADNTSHLMLIMWDCYGIEAVIDVTAEEQNCLFDMIRGKTQTFHSWLKTTLQHLTLRAQANGQRNYEVYSIWVDENITADDITSAFEENPQNMADLIRQRGRVIFRNARGSQKQVIF